MPSASFDFSVTTFLVLIHDISLSSIELISPICVKCLSTVYGLNYLLSLLLIIKICLLLMKTSDEASVAI